MTSSENWGLGKIVGVIASLITIAVFFGFPEAIPPKIDTFQPSTYAAFPGDHVTIKWRVKGYGVRVFLNTKPVQNEGTSDEIVNKPTTFALRARGLWGHAEDQFHINLLRRDGSSNRQPDPDTKCGLGQEWDESEYGFVGTWVRRDLTNLFDGRWVKGNEVVEGTLSIEIDGRRVFARRHQHGGPYDRGICDYEGTVQNDLHTVKGTYHCTWSPEAPQWTAVIRCQKE
jgi:hypothetical protein